MRVSVHGGERMAINGMPHVTKMQEKPKGVGAEPCALNQGDHCT